MGPPGPPDSNPETPGALKLPDPKPESRKWDPHSRSETPRPKSWHCRTLKRPPRPKLKCRDPLEPQTQIPAPQNNETPPGPNSNPETSKPGGLGPPPPAIPGRRRRQKMRRGLGSPCFGGSPRIWGAAAIRRIHPGPAGDSPQCPGEGNGGGPKNPRGPQGRVRGAAELRVGVGI